MSLPGKHTDENQMQNEEHLHQANTQGRKAVGLFAKTSDGDVVELAAASTASGHALLTKQLDPTAGGGGVTTVFQGGSPWNSLVTLLPSANHIGSVSIFGTVQSTPGMTTLFPGPNHIGSVTIFGTVQATPGMTTLFPGPNQIGSVTISNQPPLIAGTAQIGSVTISNQPPLIAGTAQIGSITVSNFVNPNLGNVSLNPSSAFIGLVTAHVSKIGSVIDTGNSSTAALNDDAVFTGTGADLLGYTGLTVQISSDVDSAANGMKFQFSTNNSNWDHSHSHFFDFSENPSRTFQFPAQARYFRVEYTNGAATQSHFRAQTILHTSMPGTTIHRLDDELAPDRSATIVKSVLVAQAAGSGNFVPVQSTAAGNLKSSIEEVESGVIFNSIVTVSNQQPLVAGVAQVGSVTISNMQPLVAGTAFIGLATVTTSNPGAAGMTTLFPGPSQIGSVTISNMQPLVAGTAFIGLATVTTSNPGSAGMVTLFPGPSQIGSVTISNQQPLVAGVAQIGSVTVIPVRSATTSFATYVSATGGVTIFEPPNGERWFAHSIMVNAQGATEGEIKSGAFPIWPFAGLATGGGFAVPFENPGLTAPAVDQAFVLDLNSAATVSIAVTVHFE